MSRLRALAEELKAFAPAPSVKVAVAQPVIEDDRAGDVDASVIARTAVDYVLSQLREDDAAETLGDTMVMAASALAVDLDLDLDPEPVVREAVDFLVSAALTADAHVGFERSKLSEAKSGDDYAAKLQRTQSEVARAVAFARQKLAKGDKGAAKKYVRNAQMALQRLERSL